MGGGGGGGGRVISGNNPWGHKYVTILKYVTIHKYVIMNYSTPEWYFLTRLWFNIVPTQ